MKRMIPIFLCILLLTACTGPQTPADPLSLEVEYGESGITPLCETAVDPEDAPFLVAARPSEIHLRFGSRPDSFTVHYATDADGCTNTIRDVYFDENGEIQDEYTYEYED